MHTSKFLKTWELLPHHDRLFKSLEWPQCAEEIHNNSIFKGQKYWSEELLKSNIFCHQKDHKKAHKLCTKFSSTPLQARDEALTRKLQLGPSGPNWESEHSKHVVWGSGGSGDVLNPPPPLPAVGFLGGQVP